MEEKKKSRTGRIAIIAIIVIILLLCMGSCMSRCIGGGYTDIPSDSLPMAKIVPSEEAMGNSEGGSGDGKGASDGQGFNNVGSAGEEGLSEQPKQALPEELPKPPKPPKPPKKEAQGGGGGYPDAEVLFELPVHSHTDDAVSIVLESSVEVASVEWSGTLNTKDIVLADYIEGELTSTGGDVTFKASGAYVLSADITDVYSRKSMYRRAITVYPVPTVEALLPQVIYSGEPATVSIVPKDMEGLDMEIKVSLDGAEPVPYGEIAGGKLGDTGGEIVFTTDKTGTVKLLITVTDEVGKVFEFVSNESVLKPVISFALSSPSSAFRNESMSVKVSDLKHAEGAEVAWLLSKDGVDVDISGHITGELTPMGGEISFPDLGRYVLTARVTNDVGRAFERSTEIDILNRLPSIPTTSSFINRPGVSGKFKVDFTAVSMDADGDAVTYEWEGRVADDFYTAGSHILKVRAKDERGGYSDWAEVSFEIANSSPTAPLTSFNVIRQPAIGGKFKVEFTAESTDADGEAITYEWADTMIDNLYPFGSYNVKVRAVDINGACSDWSEIAFEIVNQMPNLPTTSATVIRPAVNGLFKVGFTAVSFDIDGDAVTYEWEGRSADDFYPLGNHTVKVRAVDEHGGCSDWKDVSFEIVNTLPTLPVTSYTVSRPGVGGKFKVDFTAESTDADGDAVTYEWEGRVADDFYTAGSHILKVRAKDERGGYSDWAEVSFEIVNSSPTAPLTSFNVIRQPAIDGKFKVEFTAESTDADGEAITYEWLDTMEDSLYPFGSYNVKVRAVDINGACSDWSEIAFEIVNQMPNLPTTSATVIRPAVNGLFKVGFTAVSFDIDGDAVTYEWEGRSADDFYPLGNHTVKVRAVDEHGGVSDWKEVSFEIVNTLPTLPVTSYTVSRPGVGGKFKVDFTAQSTDADGDAVTYEWEGRVADDFYSVGNHTVKVRALDSCGAYSEWAVIDFEVVNNPPTAPIGRATPTVSYSGAKTKVDFTASGSADPDGDAFTYEWSGRTADDYYTKGAYTVKVRAVDDAGAFSDWKDVSFTVVNRAPTTPTASATVTSTTSGGKTKVTLKASGSTDPDGDAVTYQWEGKASDDYYAAGSHTVKVRAYDGSAYSAWKSVSFTVTAPPLLIFGTKMVDGAYESGKYENESDWLLVHPHPSTPVTIGGSIRLPIERGQKNPSATLRNSIDVSSYNKCRIKYYIEYYGAKLIVSVGSAKIEANEKGSGEKEFSLSGITGNQMIIVRGEDTVGNDGAAPSTAIRITYIELYNE